MDSKHLAQRKEWVAKQIENLKNNGGLYTLTKTEWELIEMTLKNTASHFYIKGMDKTLEVFKKVLE